MVLLEEMCVVGVWNFIFSLFVIVYGVDVLVLYVDMMFIGGIISLYGIFKLMIEFVMCDFVKVELNFKVIVLCYFNLVGVYEFG
ncbi:UDP-glucose 4-epimerase, partial [Enterococcus hirae]